MWRPQNGELLAVPQDQTTLMTMLDLPNYYFVLVYYNNEKKKSENKGFLKFSYQVLKPQKHSCLRIKANFFYGASNRKTH